MQKFDQALVRSTSEGWRRQGGHSLCAVCGVSVGCTIREGVAGIAGVGRVDAPIQSCRSFCSVVSFKDQTGLDGEFNTFRRGKGWANRLAKASRVGLFDLGSSSFVGYASVVGLEVGMLGMLLQDHAASNHLMKSLPPENTPTLLHAVLRKLYGNNYAAADMEFTVVQMKRE